MRKIILIFSACLINVMSFAQVDESYTIAKKVANEYVYSEAILKAAVKIGLDAAANDVLSGGYEITNVDIRYSEEADVFYIQAHIETSSTIYTLGVELDEDHNTGTLEMTGGGCTHSCGGSCGCTLEIITKCQTIKCGCGAGSTGCTGVIGMEFNAAFAVNALSN